MPVDILCVTAHPDDELLCAGIIAHHSREGKSVVIAVATDGELGVPAYDKNMPPSKLAEVRRSELLNSAGILGVEQVEFLGFEDHDEESGFTVSLSLVTQKIKEVIKKYNPQIILTHGPDGEYGHPHHKAVSRCTTEAIRLLDANYNPLLYYCNAYYPDAPVPRSNVSVEANYVFPVTGKNYEARHRVMLCHVSQLHCFIGFFCRHTERECYHRLGKPNDISDWFEVVPD